MAEFVEFEELNFKLLVVEELMHKGLLEFPTFPDPENIYACVPLPEAVAYFTALRLTSEQVANVETLNFDGGNEVYQVITPYWDGEDDSFDVTGYGESVKLPNLTEVWSVAPLSEADRAALEARGIKVDAPGPF
ncbi:DUF6892 domain-containing protein [Nocardiopsis ansamitocini]|uniref:DUF6892 domain-containing protein n=1 Tax=Nocardiopsis ansamitocini TaxID=1670832 RepID=A0A9W6PB46_9ACTN|nr:hypothetical protein [Nocardiopsis ansamitocini]GLU50308.1 hypothetical protein Nans01_46590 [Nocardiopsis ansamitocini]